MDSPTFMLDPPGLNNVQPPDEPLPDIRLPFTQQSNMQSLEATLSEPYQAIYPDLVGDSGDFNQGSFGINNGYYYHAGPIFAQGNGYGGFDDHYQYQGLPAVNHGNPEYLFMNNQHDAGPSRLGGHTRSQGIDISREVHEAPIKADGDPDQDNDLDGLKVRDCSDFLSRVGDRVREQRIERTRFMTDYGPGIDFPTEASEQRAYVKRLMAAMKSTTNVLDKACKNGKPAQAAQRLARGYYPDEDIETVCWHVLLGLKDSQMGVILVAEHHANKFERYDTFDSRFQAVIQTLSQSKAACKQLLDPSYLDRLCDAPDSELAMKLNNKKVNAERDTQNEIGRKVLTGKLRPNQVADLQVEDADAERTPSGRKKRTPKVGRTMPRGLMATVTPKSTPSSKKLTPTPKKSKSSSKGNAFSTPKKLKQEFDSDEEEDYEEEEEEEEDEEAAIHTPPSPRYSSKRKLKPVNYAEDDFQDLEDDDYAPSFYTPSKKPRNKNGQQSRSNPNWGGNLAPPPLPFAASTPIVPDPLRIPDRANGGALVPGPTFDFPQYDPEHDKRAMTEDRKGIYDSYRDVISRLLGIKPSEGKKYDLSDLRLYARAYNAAHNDSVFYAKELDEDRMHLLGHRVFEETNKVCISEHLANIIPRFRYLARLRGDLTEGNKVIRNINGPIGNVFHTLGEELEDRALGAIHNSFGLQTDLYEEQVADRDYHQGEKEQASVPLREPGN